MPVQAGVPGYNRAISLSFLLLLLASDEGDAPRPARLRAPPAVSFVAVAARGQRVLVVDDKGDVHASHDGGQTFGPPRHVGPGAQLKLGEPIAEDAALELKDPFVMQADFGYLGDNVWLDIDSPLFFRNATSDLFAFPYGTTGEEYLEFAPDSPAFWDPPGVMNLPRADIWYLDTRIFRPPTMLASRRGLLPSPAGDAFSLAIDDDGNALVAGTDLSLSSDGATWTTIAHDTQPVASRGAALDEHGVLVVDGDAVTSAAPIDGARLVARSQDRVVVATDDELYLSRDRGVTFAVRADFDHASALIIADDVFVGSSAGLFRFREDGSLEQLGEVDVAFIAADAGRVVVASATEVFELTNGALSSIAELSDEIVGIAASGDDTLVLTHGALSSLNDAPPSFSDARLDALRRARQMSPSPDEILSAARARFDPPDHRAAWAPTLNVVGGVFAADNFAILSAVFLDQTAGDQAKFVRQTAEQSTENGEDAAFERTQPYVNPFITAFLKWDLPELLSSDARASRREHGAWTELEALVLDAIRARERALEDLLLLPPQNDDVRARRTLLLQEHEARIYALTGVRFPKTSADLSSPRDGPERIVDDVLENLGLDDKHIDSLRSGAGLRAFAPMLLVSGTVVETRLDEDDLLDEIGLERPWITKSGISRLGLAHARLEWNLANIWNDDTHDDFIRISQLQRDIALGAVETYFQRRRAQALGDSQTVDELGAILSGLAGTTIDTRRDE